MNEIGQLPLIEEMLNNPATSTWLKNALIAALRRDAVDSANDAALLAAMLERRAATLLSCFDHVAVNDQIQFICEEGGIIMNSNNGLVH